MDNLNHKEECGGIVSATEFAEHFGLTDFSMVKESVLDAAQEFGDAVHLLFSYSAENRLKVETVDALLVPYLEGFKKIIADNQIKFLETEIRHTSRLGFTGRPDIVCMKKNELTIIDTKTPKKVSKSCGIQLAGYEILINEYGKYGRVKKKFALHAGTPDLKLIPFNEKHFTNDFLSLLNTFNLQKEYMSAKKFEELRNKRGE